MRLLGVLAAVLITGKVLSVLARRLGQPAVLGELAAGLLLGKSLLNLVDPADPVIKILAEIGVIVLLFTIGLETELRRLIRVGTSALAVACTGVVLPFVLGYLAARALGLDALPALVCGAALTATSVGISMRVLSDLGRLTTEEGQIVLGAAVIDDVIGLVILSIVSALVAGSAVTVGHVSLTVALAVGFLILAIGVGSRVARPLFRFMERGALRHGATPIAIVFAITLAWLAHRSGSAAMMGGFAAGLILNGVSQRDEIEKVAMRLGQFFVPIFFAAVGAAVDLRVFGDARVVEIAAVLFAVGVVGKFAAGFAPFWFRGTKSLIGVAMIPRGEVGLIFAQMGLASGALDVRMFSAITIMVMATTFLVPPLLSRFKSENSAANDNPPGRGGVDDLVA